MEYEKASGIKNKKEEEEKENILVIFFVQSETR